MDNFNKVASFILGLVVVVIFIALLTGRINLGKRLTVLNTKPTATPTPTKKITIATTTNTESQTKETTSAYHSYTQNNQSTKTSPSRIPSTGPETALLPLLFSGAGIGYFLKKIKSS